MWLFNLLFSSLSQLWYVEVRISWSVSVSPLEFEITSVDCISVSELFPLEMCPLPLIILHSLVLQVSDGKITIDFLLPNGMFIPKTVDFDMPLDMLKQVSCLLRRFHWIHTRYALIHYENMSIYSNILKISPPKTESFQVKFLIFFIFLLKTQIVGTCLNCLDESVLLSTHSIFLSRNKKK